MAKVAIRSTSSFRISSWVTSAARFGLDWLSLMMISNGCCVPLTVMLPPIDFFTWSSTKGMCSVKKASGPVVGCTTPILIVLGADSALVMKPGAAVAAAPAARPVRACLRFRRRSFPLIDFLPLAFCGRRRIADGRRLLVVDDIAKMV